MDFAKARFNMIEQQIRPWNVLDQSVLDLLSVVKREEFVCESLRNMALTDCDLPIRINGQETGEFMFSPKLEARLLQELHVTPTDKVLEIGTGTGYMAALLANKAAHVVSVEINQTIAESARNTLKRLMISRVKVVDGCGFSSANELGKFDVIMVSGACEVLPEALIELLNPNGRMMTIVGKEPILQATLTTKASTGQFASTPLFETYARPLQNAPKAAAFEF